MSKSPDAFRTISEVAEFLDIPAHVLRFWESKFSQVKPVKRAGGRRYYRPADMALLAGIKQLLHEDGLTIKGAQKVLREQGVKHVSSLVPLDENGNEEPVEDAPFIEVEAPQPEETLVAFPGTEHRADPVSAKPPEPAPAEPEPPEPDPEDEKNVVFTDTQTAVVPEQSTPDSQDVVPDADHLPADQQAEVLQKAGADETANQTDAPQEQGTSPALDANDFPASPAEESAPAATPMPPLDEAIEPEAPTRVEPETAQPPYPPVPSPDFESPTDTPDKVEDAPPSDAVAAPAPFVPQESQGTPLAADMSAPMPDSGIGANEPSTAQPQPSFPEDTPAIPELDKAPNDPISAEDAALDAMENTAVCVDQEKAMQAAQRLAEQIVTEGITEQTGPLRHLASLHQLGPTEARALEPHLAALRVLHSRLTTGATD